MGTKIGREAVLFPSGRRKSRSNTTSNVVRLPRLARNARGTRLSAFFGRPDGRARSSLATSCAHEDSGWRYVDCRKRGCRVPRHCSRPCRRLKLWATAEGRTWGRSHATDKALRLDVLSCSAPRVLMRDVLGACDRRWYCTYFGTAIVEPQQRRRPAQLRPTAVCSHCRPAMVS